jgi:hypothetical protein
MAGTLTISTLSDGTNSTSSTNCIQGSAKAWVNFNGSGGAINASYNVSSITVNGTGDYTINFTNAMASSNYSITSCCGTSAVGTPNGLQAVMYVNPQTTSIRVGTVYVNGTLANFGQVCTSIFSA